MSHSQMKQTEILEVKSKNFNLHNLKILCQGNHFLCTDFAVGLNWSNGFAVLTNRKLLHIKVTSVCLNHCYTVDNRQRSIVACEISLKCDRTFRM